MNEKILEIIFYIYLIIGIIVFPWILFYSIKLLWKFYRNLIVNIFNFDKEDDTTILLTIFLIIFNGFLVGYYFKELLEVVKIIRADFF